MICYKDMTFCSSGYTNSQCGRHESKTKRNTAGLDVMWSDFYLDCGAYKAKKRVSYKPESDQAGGQ